MSNGMYIANVPDYPEVEPVISPHTGSLEMKVLFDDLPLGVRIKYVGGDDIWTIVGQHRDLGCDWMKGKIAKWEPDLTKLGMGTKRWHQSICGHYPETEEDRWVILVG